MKITRSTWILLIASSIVAAGALSGASQVNAAPVAAFSVRPADEGAPAAVTLDASASYDPDGRIVSFQWSFGDGFTGSGAVRSHTYATMGEYQVTLLVTDDRGATNLLRRTIDLARPLEPTSAVEEPRPKTGTPTTAPVGTAVGYRAPEFALPGIEGGVVRLSDYLGRPVILDFWSSACAACRAATPHLESLRALYADRDLAVILVVLDPVPSDAARFLANGGFTEFVVAREVDSSRKETMHAYGVGQIPHAVFIDRAGVIRYTGVLARLRAETIDPWI